jgi:hypothetical protein
MARWRQDRLTGKLVPIDDAARKGSTGAVIHGDIESFVSPVDGTVITDRKQLSEHNKRNNVVSADEFSPEHYARKAEERAKFFNGEHSKQEKLERKSEIYERMMAQERQ